MLPVACLPVAAILMGIEMCIRDRQCGSRQRHYQAADHYKAVRGSIKKIDRYRVFVILETLYWYCGVRA